MNSTHRDRYGRKAPARPVPRKARATEVARPPIEGSVIGSDHRDVVLASPTLIPWRRATPQWQTMTDSCPRKPAIDPQRSHSAHLECRVGNFCLEEKRADVHDVCSLMDQGNTIISSTFTGSGDGSRFHARAPAIGANRIGTFRPRRWQNERMRSESRDLVPGNGNNVGGAGGPNNPRSPASGL